MPRSPRPNDAGYGVQGGQWVQAMRVRSVDGCVQCALGDFRGCVANVDEPMPISVDPD